MSERLKWDHKWKTQSSQKNSIFSRKILRFLSPKTHQSILEVWAWIGEDAIFFAKKWFQVRATDYSQNAIDRITFHGNPNIKTSILDLTSIPKNIWTYDIVYAHLSLHYFSDSVTQEIFTTLKSHLKPGGYLCVKCKSTDDMLAQRCTPDNKGITSIDGKVYHFFSRTYMKQLAEDLTITYLRKTHSTYRNYRSSFIELIAQKQ